MLRNREIHRNWQAIGLEKNGPDYLLPFSAFLFGRIDLKENSRANITNGNSARLMKPVLSWDKYGSNTVFRILPHSRTANKMQRGAHTRTSPWASGRRDKLLDPFISSEFRLNASTPVTHLRIFEQPVSQPSSYLSSLAASLLPEGRFAPFSSKS